MKAIICGTGPSLTPEVIAQVNASGLPVYGCNNTYQLFDLTAHLACNIEWWNHYYPTDKRLQDMQDRCWTWDRPTSQKYGVNYIEGRWGDSLSTDPKYIHYGHSSGYQLLGLAYHFGVREMVLVGYDLKYGKDYNGIAQVAGGNRHYFGEYPPNLQHWTKYNIGSNGELNGLLDCYRTIDCEKLGLRIINTSPDTALDFFETAELQDVI